jgi:fucose 4-O-acetylase-like acetyltransferase
MASNVRDESTKPAQTRDRTIDVGRGIAISLVVLGHALVGMTSAGGGGWVSNFLLISIYSTHMAFFFLLSGLFSSSMVKKDWPDFSRALAVRIVWPYVLWSIVILFIHYKMSAYTNLVLDGFYPWRILWKPPSVMWFLYVLLVAMVILRLCAALPASATALFGAFLVLLTYAFDAVPQELRFIGLFLLSAALGHSRLYLFQSDKVVIGSALIMAISILRAYQLSGEPVTGYPAFRAEFIPALIAGPVLLLWLSRQLASVRFGAVLDYIGQRTMPIFVTHILVTAGVRIVLVRLGLTDWTVIVLAATVLGVVLPLIADRVAASLRLRPILGWR